ncbi:collagen alpha-1(XII) chain-like [Cheilinus undulatus]|uniref:collagen alpha-1(XII) chain-like n=1 Tax=Cheilinus undulatus TaxID=241271 RepID=UPI001BD58A08|nr:collagen alpha-1(XII) chain-like [Cheilinus undulatus]
MALLEVIFAVGLLFEVVNSQEKIYRILQPEQDATLPCGSPSSSGPLQCSDISWLYNRDPSETVMEASSGEVKQTSSRADRLSLDSNCSLVIKRVTAEDVGLYMCRRGDSDPYDVNVYLSLFTVFPTLTHSDPRSPNDPRLECSLLRYRGLSSCQPNSLRWVDETGAVITDGVTESSRDADCFSDLNVTHQISNNGKFSCQSVNEENNVEIQADYTPFQPGTRCKMTAKADIVLLVDVSSSISPDDFRTILRFITDIVGMFDIGPDRVQIGLTQYSDVPRTQWHLNVHRTKKSLLKGVNDLQHIGGGTETGRALTHILENDFKPEVGMREDSRKIVILFTDGESTDFVIMPSQHLRDNGIELYAIGVDGAGAKELKSIASDPHDTHMYLVKNFDDLLDITTTLTDNVCDSIKGPGTQCKTTAKADIVLLVDDSGSISPENFRTILHFITDIVGMFDIGPNRVQIGLTQYSDVPKTQWHLNVHRTKKSLLKGVNDLQHIGGGTETGRALTHILENDFQPNVGMREDSQKIVILFTDGESTDFVIMPSQHLRDNGIELYAIGRRWKGLNKVC